MNKLDCEIKKLIEKALPESSLGITGLHIEENGISVYGFIDEKTFELEDVEIMIQGMNVLPSSTEKFLIKDKLHKYHMKHNYFPNQTDCFNNHEWEKFKEKCLNQ